MMLAVEVIKANRKISERTAGKLTDILRVAPYARVSTDSEEQLNSYKSQVAYYSDLVEKRQDWILADIYADEAITGTQVTKRENFQRMINDCLGGKIDMVITKSISRFARNTLDTLKYVRMLKERNIAVFFENINTNTKEMPY
jgi:site-specific DNA recombinase